MRAKKEMGVLATGLILALILGLTGCMEMGSTRRDREVVARQPIATSYGFEDIPIPPGMSLDRKSSFIYETRATKTGLLIYEGEGEIGQLAKFFKQQMPSYQWRLVSNFEYQNVMLTFIKEGWSSVIYILPQNDRVRRIEIRVGPIEIKILPPS